MTYQNFTKEIDSDGIALYTWDMKDKSMNVIDATVIEDIKKIVDEVKTNDEIKGLIFTSGKSAFSGGADLNMLKGILAEFHATKEKDPEGAAQQLFDGVGEVNRLFRELETCGKPSVCAINGTCMGGAFELALACTARIASDNPKLRLGLPEVKVGLFPGAGGTQRLPRLTNTQDALQMLLKGQSLKATRAKAMGLVDAVVPHDELVAAAKAKLAEGLDPVKPWDKRGFKFPGGAVYTPQGFQTFPPANAIYRRETYDNYPGARAIMKCVYEGMLLPMDLAIKVETRYFANVLQSTEAAMMIRSLFISMQELNKGARRPQSVAPNKITKVGVVGAGFMGAGIAYVSAKAGIDVVLIDQSIEAAEKGKAHSEGLLDKGMKRGAVTQEMKDAHLNRITASDDYATLKDCQLVVEAVFEDRSVKKDVTEKVEAHISEDAIFASNTSTLPITSLAEASKRQDQFIGIHFFSPVDKMMLVEIIMGEKTGDKALAMAIDFVASIKKTPIVVNDTRGFFANRCVLRYMSEAYNMLIEGVPPAMIENAAKMAGMPIGPLALNDEVAIDLSQKILNATVKDLGEGAIDQRHIDLVNDLVDKHDRRGRKNGKGFYNYPEKPAKKHLWPELKTLFKQQDADSIDVNVLKQRFLVTQAVEAAKTIEEGVVTDVREADVGSILGFGFAPFTGGTLSYIDGMGVDKFVELAKALAKDYGDHFAPCALLEEMAKNGETFYGRFDPYNKPSKAA